MHGNARKPAVSVVIALLSAVLGVRVTDERPRTLPDKFVVVSRVGGVKRNVVTDSPMLTFECWGKDDLEAEQLAGAVADALEDSPGGYVTYRDAAGLEREAWISHHTEIGGPARNPDPAVDRGRWTLTVELGISTNV